MSANKMQERFERIVGLGAVRFAKGDDGRYIDAQTQLAYFCFCLGAESILNAYTDFMGANGYASGRQYVLHTAAPPELADCPSCGAEEQSPYGGDDSTDYCCRACNHEWTAQP